MRKDIVNTIFTVMSKELCGSIIKCLENKAKKKKDSLIWTPGEWANFWEASIMETEPCVEVEQCQE